MSDNQRVKITKLLLKNSLIGLMKDKSIYKISITEICTLAGVNRSTFYKYYNTEYELLKDIENEYLNAISLYLEDINTDSTLTEILGYVTRNKDVFNLFLDASSGNEFFQRLIALCLNKMKYVNRMVQYPTASENDYLYHFIIYGALSVVKRWISNDQPETPAELAEILMKFLIQYINPTSTK